MIDNARRHIWTLIFFSLLFFPATGGAQTGHGTFSLEETVRRAVSVNLDIRISRDGVAAAAEGRQARRAAFFPAFSATYSYTRHNEEQRLPFLGVTFPENEYAFVATVRQPLFAGFALKNRYDLAGLNLEAATLAGALAEQRIVFAAKSVYFRLLKARKLLDVSTQTVKQIQAQVEDAKNFYEVGMTPLNDYLQAQVELANAQQNLLTARNTLEIARSDFNTLLRRPLGAPARLEDVQTFVPLSLGLDDCLAEAENSRIELRLKQLEIDSARKQVLLARKDFYPAVSLEGNYYQLGTTWDVKGGSGISDPSSWDIRAVATWTFWEWGKTRHEVRQAARRLQQKEKEKESTREKIRFEVKEAYLRTREAEKNIHTIEKAIAQAEENYRINKERYRQQIATSTQVLDAQTLLARTRTSYYTALYDFKILKAGLYRAMGRGM